MACLFFVKSLNESGPVLYIQRISINFDSSASVLSLGFCCVVGTGPKPITGARRTVDPFGTKDP